MNHGYGIERDRRSNELRFNRAEHNVRSSGISLALFYLNGTGDAITGCFSVIALSVATGISSEREEKSFCYCVFFEQNA
jgi:hypothetical protein